MKKTYRYVRIFAAVIVGLLSLAALTGIFYPVKIFDVQVTALAQRVFIDFSLAAVLLFVGVLLLTLLFGRIYCSTLCPFGLMQEFLAFIFRRKRKPLHRKSHPYKYFIAAVVFGALIGGTAYLIWLIDPYTLFRSFPRFLTTKFTSNRITAFPAAYVPEAVRLPASTLKIISWTMRPASNV